MHSHQKIFRLIDYLVISLEKTYFQESKYICTFTKLSKMYKNKREILSQRIFSREISSLVTPLVKTLVSRNFCQKYVISTLFLK